MKISIHTIVGLCLIASAATVIARPRLQTGPDAEITYDGLARIDRTVVDAAWVKPDLNLRAYDKLMLVGAGLSYKAVDDEGERWRPGTSNQSEFPISEEARERLQQELRDAFLEEMQDLERYEIVTEPGPGTLLLYGGVIDIVSYVPPVDTCTMRCDVFLSRVADATLVLELRDSLSNEVLLRVADRRSAEKAGWPIEINQVTAWAEVRRLAQYWGQRVRKGLDDLETIDDVR